MRIAVCIKQVPAVSELPWDPRKKRLGRDRAGGMMDPASRHALEAGLTLGQSLAAEITVLSMGPAEAEEELRAALALGAHRAVLISDPRLAGADTLATSYTLAQALRRACPGADLILLGCHTADSETGQVGPQLAVHLDLPCASGAESLELVDGLLRIKRVSDGFRETLEVAPPAVVTVSMRGFVPRAVPLTGVEPAFNQGQYQVLDAFDLGGEPERLGQEGSPSVMKRVYPTVEERQGVVLTGAPAKVVEQLLEDFGDRMGGLMGLDLGGGK